MLEPIKTKLLTHARKSKAFTSDESGALIIFALFMLVIMLAVAGLAVDFMRAETLRVRLQNALDRSVLAGASMSQSLDSKQVVIDYFEHAGLGEYLDRSSITVTETSHNKSVSAKASGEISPFFLKLIGYGDIPVRAAAMAKEGFTDLEVSLILDVSGSMDWDSSASGRKKLEDLKDAAQEFVYRVQCNPETDNIFTDPCTVKPNSVSINLVLYQEQVLVGEDLLRRFNVTYEHLDSSCVDFTSSDYFTTAITPDQPLLRAGQIDSYTWWWKDVPNSHYANDGLRTCLNRPELEIVPLEDDWITLYDKIEALTALGGTSIEMGLKWGSALLDPAFQPITSQLVLEGKVIPEFAPRPASFSDPNIKKFIVLMSDGTNTYHFELKEEFRNGKSEVWYDNDADGDPNTDDEYVSIYRDAQDRYINPITGVWSDAPGGDDPRQLNWPEVWSRFGTDFYANGRNNADAHTWTQNPVNEVQSANKNADMVQMCASASDNLIQIFTLGFETTPDAVAHLKKCASSEAHHFDADGADLDQAFAAIARSIQKLRLVY